MEKLIEGYRRFRETEWPDRRALFETLAARGQQPTAAVVACADSRVDPQLIFGAGPGELFVVRNVANLVPPYSPDAAYHGTSAALEFAVRGLQVQHIVVLGHGLCGGVKVLLEGAPAPVGDFVEPWMAIAEPARRRVMTCERVEERQFACELEVVKVSLQNLSTFPWIRERVDRGRLVLHGCHFDVRTGILMRLDRSGAFFPVD